MISYNKFLKAVIKGIPEVLDSGCKTRTLDFGRWAVDSGSWTLDAGL